MLLKLNKFKEAREPREDKVQVKIRPSVSPWVSVKEYKWGFLVAELWRSE